METSRRSSTDDDDDEQQAQRDHRNKEVLDIIGASDATQIAERNTDGLHGSASLDARLDRLIERLEGENESLHEEIESLYSKINEKKVKLEAANAALDAMVDIAEQRNKTLRTTFALKLRILMQVAIYGRTLDVTAIKNETRRIVQLLVDIRDALSRLYQANLEDLRQLRDLCQLRETRQLRAVVRQVKEEVYEDDSTSSSPPPGSSSED